jgi:hypothetical protein
MRALTAQALPRKLSFGSEAARPLSVCGGLLAALSQTDQFDEEPGDEDGGWVQGFFIVICIVDTVSSRVLGWSRETRMAVAETVVPRPDGLLGPGPGALR